MPISAERGVDPVLWVSERHGGKASCEKEVEIETSVRTCLLGSLDRRNGLGRAATAQRKHAVDGWAARRLNGERESKDEGRMQHAHVSIKCADESSLLSSDRSRISHLYRCTLHSSRRRCDRCDESGATRACTPTSVHPREHKQGERQNYFQAKQRSAGQTDWPIWPRPSCRQPARQNVHRRQRRACA